MAGALEENLLPKPVQSLGKSFHLASDIHQINNLEWIILFLLSGNGSGLEMSSLCYSSE